MSNKKQLLAILFSLALVAFNANAAMTNTNSGDSSLVLTVINGNSATFDLGFNYSSYSSELFALSNASSGGQYYTWDLANDSNYADSWALLNAARNIADVSWGIFAGDNTGAGAGARGVVSTYASGSTNLITNQLVGLLNDANIYFDENNILGSHSSNDNGSAVSSNGVGHSSRIYQTTLLNRTRFEALSGIDTSMTLVTLTTASSAFALASVAQPLNDFGYNPTYTLTSNGILTYYNGRLSPINVVPEAGTWAMMLLGLGTIAGFSRVRKSKLKSNLYA